MAFANSVSLRHLTATVVVGLYRPRTSAPRRRHRAMTRMSRHRHPVRVIGALAATAFLWTDPASPTVTARQIQPAAALRVLEVRPNIHLIAGAGGNITVQIGSDGVVLVDTGS